MLVGGAVATTPARLVGAGEPVLVRPPPPRFVSRAGAKLDAALDRFGVPTSGERALDVGASTGGFTDCLLQRGAAAVVAVDVGRNQLHERLRADPRVTSLERTDIRHLEPPAVGGPFPLVVADLSFISLAAVVDALLAATTSTGHLVLLVKPQFEASRAEVSRGRGVIRDPEVWRRALEDVHAALHTRGAAIMGVMASPLRGADGNVEFLVHVRPPGAELDSAPLTAAAVGLAAGVEAGDP